VPGQTLFGGAILNRRETTSKVIIKNGQTIVLSGILTDSESQITRGIPLLSDIPFIGELFKSHENSKTTTELIAFITPIVVDNPAENDTDKAHDRLKSLAQPLKQQAKNAKTITQRILEDSDSQQPTQSPAQDQDKAKDKSPEARKHEDSASSASPASEGQPVKPNQEPHSP